MSNESSGKKNTSGVIGYGCLAMFGLPFAIVGLLALFNLYISTLNTVRVRFWSETPCDIVSVELEEDHDDGSTTYALNVQYRYVWQGQEYVSKRVFPMSGVSDGNEGFYRHKFNELEQAKNSGTPFRCFVNPRHPATAILYRDARSDSMFLLTVAGVLFAAVGWGLTLGMGYALWKEYKKTDFPAGKPLWEQRDDWAKGEIIYTPASRGRLLFWIGVTAVTLSLPSIIAGSLDLLDTRSPWSVVAFIPMLLATIVMYYSDRYMAKARRFGQSTFQMVAVPGILGGSLSGVVRCERRINTNKGFVARLYCERHISDSDGSSLKVIWDKSEQIERDLSGDNATESAIPIIFDVPYNCLESNKDDSNGKDLVDWKLVVETNDESIGYKAEFVVPMFKTTDSDKTMTDEEIDIYDEDLDEEDDDENLPNDSSNQQ